MNNNNVIDVAIDFGGSRIKAIYRGKDNSLNHFVMRNNYVFGATNNLTGYLVKRDNYAVRISTFNGTENRENVKTNYEHLNDFILVIAKQIKDELNLENDIQLNIKTLLPPSQFQSVAEAFTEKIMSFGTFTGTVNDDEVTVTIKDVSVSCEGVALVMAADIDSVCKLDKALLLDVGSSTIDVVQLQLDGNNWIILNAFTINDVSGSSIISDITSGINREFNDTSYKASDLERNMFFYVGETRHEVIDYIDFAAARISTLKKSIFNKYYDGGKVILTGGGAKLLANSKMFRELCKVEPVVMDDDICTFGNALGAYYFG